jgi:AAA+ superfamily predicted ATPase
MVERADVTERTGKSAKRPPRGILESPDINGLLPLFQGLDQRLAQAIDAEHAEGASEVATAPYRGLLQLEPEAVEQLLAREPRAPRFLREGEVLGADRTAQIREDSPLAWLQQIFDLSVFDLEVVAIALAPELDRRYEGLYAYLQEDVRCKRPTVDLALNLLCASPTEKLARRSQFATDAPLIRHQLLHLFGETDRGQPTLLARELYLDDQVIHLLLGQPGLDGRLAPYCQLLKPADSLEAVPLTTGVKEGLARFTLHYWQNLQPLRLHFQGPDRGGRQQVAQALAGEASVPLLVANLARMVETKADFELTLKLIYREAWFQNAWLYFDNLDALSTEGSGIFERSLLTALAEHPGISILGGEQPWSPTATGPLGMVTIHFPIPDFDRRRGCWQNSLAAAGIEVNGAELDALCDRFYLTPNQIADAVATACNRAQWDVACGSESERAGTKRSSKRTSPTPQVKDLFAAARAQSGHDLATLARKIEPKYGWEDIVLPPGQSALLRELCKEAKYQHRVWEEWGFAHKFSLGKGLNVLFSGPPGTGKTMAAEVIAHELQLDLYKIDLSQMVSKYIGETEKNLNRIFTAATNSNAILFFDEADALFGKRSEVRDAHDRYANIETSYLLQKMEEYEGVAILTTNLRGNMDEAFVRRLRFIIEFVLPSVQERRSIWEQIWPQRTPRSPDLDLDFLAHQFEIPGANIRNIALRAAFLAADDGGMVNMEHLMGAVRREYQKMGKILMVEELGGYAGLL